jgi:hypothetical protein
MCNKLQRRMPFCSETRVTKDILTYSRRYTIRAFILVSSVQEAALLEQTLATLLTSLYTIFVLLRRNSSSPTCRRLPRQPLLLTNAVFHVPISLSSICAGKTYQTAINLGLNCCKTEKRIGLQFQIRTTQLRHMLVHLGRRVCQRQLFSLTHTWSLKPRSYLVLYQSRQRLVSFPIPVQA